MLDRKSIRDRLIAIKTQSIGLYEHISLSMLLSPLEENHKKMLERLEEDHEKRTRGKFDFPAKSKGFEQCGRSGVRGCDFLQAVKENECEKKRRLLKKYQENGVKDQHRHLPSCDKSIANSQLRRDWAIEDSKLELNRSMSKKVPAGGAKAAFAMFQQKDKESGGTGKAKAAPGKMGPKDMLLQWCRDHTVGYEHVNIANFSSSWADGMAFCALIHSFFPDAFDFKQLDPKNRKHNLDLAFDTAQQKANIAPLLATEDMLLMGDKPDWKCVFTYIQAIYKGLSTLNK